MDATKNEERSVWWTVAGVLISGATGIGVGYALANRDKPCACKAKPPENGTTGNGPNGSNGSGSNG